MLAASAVPALALTKEAAVESCRGSIGKPFVQGCVRSLGGRKSGDFEANLAACRAKIVPKVHDCVVAAMNAANGRANVAVGVPTEAEPAAPANALPVGFVAPPRTIADITAILDSEKPDVKKLEQLKSDADDQPTGKESRGDLAEFYLDRGNARAQLGRLADAIADANKAVEAGKGAVSMSRMGRMLQLAAMEYALAGDPKKALEIMQRVSREAQLSRVRWDTSSTPTVRWPPSTLSWATSHRRRPSCAATCRCCSRREPADFRYGAAITRRSGRAGNPTSNSAAPSSSRRGDNFTTPSCLINWRSNASAPASRAFWHRLIR